MPIDTLLLLAAAVAGPGQDATPSGTSPLIAIDPGDWVTDIDYPKAMLHSGAVGQLHFLVEVDAAGKATACRILRTSGYGVLDDTGCALILMRARFRPARGADGKPIAATYRSKLTWKDPEVRNDEVQKKLAMIREPFELALTVTQMPSGYREPALLRVRFGRDGVPIGCNVEQSSGSSSADQVACRQASALRTSEGDNRISPRPDTRTVRVSFTAEPAK